jgi:hypothetical protein
MGVAHRAGDHVFHVLPQCQFMAKFRFIGAPRDLIPLADPDPLAHSDGHSFIRFRAHPDARLFKLSGVQPKSVLAVSLLHEPSVPLDSQPILPHSSEKNANWLRTHFLVWRICANEAPFFGESAELRSLPHEFRAPLRITMRISNQWRFNESCSFGPRMAVDAWSGLGYGQKSASRGTPDEKPGHPMTIP